MSELNDRLSTALMRVFKLEGVKFCNGDVCISAGHLNNYIVAGVLSGMFANGELEIKGEPKDLPYLKRLLGME